MNKNRRVFSFFSILISIFVYNDLCFGMYSASPPNTIQVRETRFFSESGKTRSIGDDGISDDPLVLVPAYFQCSSTCPLLAENLKNLMSNSQMRFAVLFLSFDPKDSVESMRVFRENHKLPIGWRLGVIQNQAFAKEFLSQFLYSFQTTEDGFDHPNAAFVFSPKSLVWTGSLYGSGITLGDLGQAYNAANLANQVGVNAGLHQLISKKEYLILYGLIGTIFPFFYVIYFFLKKRTNNRKAKRRPKL